MGLDILEALGKLSPIFTNAAGALGKNQDTNTVLANSAAASRPGIVASNLSNSRRADLMRNFKRPQLNWGGPGSVAKGMMPTVTGGPGPEGADVHSLEDTVTQDALAQAKGNYGLKDPAEGGIGSDILGGLGMGSSILGALGKLKPGSLAPGANPAAGPTAASSIGKGGLPPLPVAGGGGRSGGWSGIPGVWQNPDGSMVYIGGDAANGGGYGGGLFGGQGDTGDPRHD